MCSLGLWYVKSCILPVVNAVSIILVVIRAQYQTTLIFYTVIFEREKKNDAPCTNNDLDTLYIGKISRTSQEENYMEPRNLDEMMLTAKLKLWSNLTNITNILF